MFCLLQSFFETVRISFQEYAYIGTLLRPMPVRVCSALDFKSAFRFLQVRSLQTDEQRSIIREANAERNRCVSV